MAHMAYRFVPRRGGGFHLGREGLEQEVSAETFPSDSLFAALVIVMVQLYGPEETSQYLQNWPLDGVDREPPFRVSSLFPYIGDIPLLPLPRLRIHLTREDRPQTAKILKKLAFVSPGILTGLLAGSVMDDWLPDPGKANKGLLLQEGKVWIAAEEVTGLPARFHKSPSQALYETRLWNTGTVPRVTIDRVSNRSNIYQVGRTVFMEDCGLWMLADLNGDTALLENLLLHLGDTGIGGERSAGYGGFAPDVMTPPRLPSPAGTSRLMTLSRYSPTAAELETGVLGEGASYDLVDVGGWLASPGSRPQRRKRLRMIEAGSVLVASTAITGQVVDVRPEYPYAGAPAHPVYRGGVALTIGVTGGN